MAHVLAFLNSLHPAWWGVIGAIAHWIYAHVKTLVTKSQVKPTPRDPGNTSR